MTIKYLDSKRITSLSTDFTTPIVWQNMTDGQSASGNVLSKSGTNWTADATGTTTFSSSVGAKVEFTVSANTSDSFCGFDISTNTDSYNMDYALYCGGGGTINIYANGSQVTATSETYSTADTLAVNMDSSGTVTFLKNGSVFYTSSTTASGTYRVNAVIYTSGVSLTANYVTDRPTNVETNSILVEKDTANRYWFDAESDSADNITWSTTGKVGYNISGTTISRTGSAGWSLSKIQSEDTFTVGEGIFMIEFSGNAPASNSTQLGFNKGTLGYHHGSGSPQNNCDFAIYMAGGSQLEVYESGSKNYDSGGARSASDKYRIEINNDGLVKYYLQAGGTGSWVKKHETVGASGTYFIQANSYSSASEATVHSKTVTTPATWNLEGLEKFYDTTATASNADLIMQVASAGHGTRVGVKILSGSTAIGKYIQNIKFKLSKFSSPSGNYQITVRDSSDTVKATANFSATGLPTSATIIDHDIGSPVKLAEGDRILYEYGGASGTKFWYNNSSGVSGFAMTYYNYSSAYVDDSTDQVIGAMDSQQ